MCNDEAVIAARQTDACSWPVGIVIAPLLLERMEVGYGQNSFNDEIDHEDEQAHSYEKLWHERRAKYRSVSGDAPPSVTEKAGKY
jgi:hypothetical protein